MDVEILGDRYELQEPIGRGGMATIYRAVDLRMGRSVAVKILREVYSSDPKFVTRFQREARAASLLQHPNIVQVFDYGQSGESYYIVMEFVDGTDLRKYLKRHGRLSNERVASIARDVALGLGAAHKRGIVHRDVKPQNILLNEEDVVKLTDFGIASVYKDAGAERLTTTGMTLGTVQYYAPEQAQGEVVSPSADIYAMGIVMYEMLTGRTPFDGDTPVAVAMKHIQEMPDPPSRYNPNVAPALERIIMRCLEKDPRDRYRDGDALAYALENFERRPSGRPTAASAGRLGAPLSLPADPRPGPGFGPAAYGAPSGPSGPSGPGGMGRGAAVVSGPMGARGPGSRNFDTPGARTYDAPGISTRPYGPAGGTMPRSPSTGRGSSGPLGLPRRPDDDEKGRGNGPIVAIVVSAVVLLLGLSCFLVFSLSGGALAKLFASPTPTATQIVVQIPRFKGMTLTAAQALAQTNHLTLTVVTQTPDPNDANPPPANQVLDQNPEPGPYNGTISSIQVTVQGAPNKAIVPYVIGKDGNTACDLIGKAHLICVNVGTIQSNQPAGTVVKTDPLAGTQVDPQSEVQYWLSTGPATPTPTKAAPTATATCTPGPTPTPGGPGGVC
ncbi:MAG TPA: protein kinase [Ktedonobacterales bacterium]